jgi:signal transduction histidine kinase
LNSALKAALRPMPLPRLIPLRSTTFRLAVLVFLLQVVAGAALLLGLGALIRQQNHAEAVNLAENLRDDLLTIASPTDPRSTLAKAIDERLSRRLSRGIVLALVDSRGQIIAGNIESPLVTPTPGRAPRTLDMVRRGHAHAEATLVVPTTLAGGDVLLAGTVVESDRQFLAIVERASLAALAMAVVLAAFAAVVAARQIASRLQATIITLGGVGQGNLSRRVPPDSTGDAFAVLGEEVNQALDRVAALNAELKIATDLLAHDLKSPLTRLSAALDRAEGLVEDQDAADAIARARAESARILAMVDTALSISRAEAGLGRESFREADLVQVLETIEEIYEPVLEEQDRTLSIEAPPRLLLPIHRQLINQAIGNLLDNTIKYGEGPIVLSLELMPEAVLLGVSDQGSGIAPDLREKALSRFGRLDEARGGWGAGLGLALVQAVAHLHGGTVILGDGPGGKGLRVTLRLPLAKAVS